MSEEEGNDHTDNQQQNNTKKVDEDDLNRKVFETMLVVVMILIAAVVGTAIYIKFSYSQDISIVQISGEFKDIEKIDDGTIKIVFSDIKPEKGISDITLRLETKRGSDFFKLGSDKDGAQVVAVIEDDEYTFNYTDQSDNGKINSEDFLTIAPGSSSSWSSFESGTYIFTMIWEGSMIDEISFSY